MWSLSGIYRHNAERSPLGPVLHLLSAAKSRGSQGGGHDLNILVDV